MTDNEIVKALECCTGDGLCCECPFWEKLSANCIVELNRLALEIIKRQQAELHLQQTALSLWRADNDR